MSYVIVATPKPGAPYACWLAEWQAVGPFADIAEADAALRRINYESHTVEGPSQWHRRVVRVVAPAAVPA